MVSCHRVVSFTLYCGMIFYYTIIDNTTLFHDIITQIKPPLELSYFCFINEFYLTEVFVNLFLYVTKIYNRAIKNMTSEIYVLNYVIMYE